MTLASLGNAVLFAVVAIALFAVAVGLLARVLPGRLWQRAIEENQSGPAILLGAIVLAVGWIVAAAFH